MWAGGRVVVWLFVELVFCLATSQLAHANDSVHSSSQLDFSTALPSDQNGSSDDGCPKETGEIIPRSFILPLAGRLVGIRLMARTLRYSPIYDAAVDEIEPVPRSLDSPAMHDREWENFGDWIHVRFVSDWSNFPEERASLIGFIERYFPSGTPLLVTTKGGLSVRLRIDRSKKPRRPIYRYSEGNEDYLLSLDWSEVDTVAFHPSFLPPGNPPDSTRGYSETHKAASSQGGTAVPNQIAFDSSSTLRTGDFVVAASAGAGNLGFGFLLRKDPLAIAVTNAGTKSLHVLRITEIPDLRLFPGSVHLASAGMLKPNMVYLLFEPGKKPRFIRFIKIQYNGDLIYADPTSPASAQPMIIPYARLSAMKLREPERPAYSIYKEILIHPKAPFVEWDESGFWQDEYELNYEPIYEENGTRFLIRASILGGHHIQSNLKRVIKIRKIQAQAGEIFHLLLDVKAAAVKRALEGRRIPMKLELEQITQSREKSLPEEDAEFVLSIEVSPTDAEELLTILRMTSFFKHKPDPIGYDQIDKSAPITKTQIGNL